MACKMHKHTLQHTIKKHATHTNRHSHRHNKHSPTLTHTRRHKPHSTSTYRQDLRSYAQQTKHTHTHTCIQCWLMCRNKGQMLWHRHKSTIWSENVQQLISSYVWWWHGFAERRHVRVISATTLTARSTQHAENTYTRRISIKSLSRLTLACPHNPQIIRLDECAQLHS